MQDAKEAKEVGCKELIIALGQRINTQNEILQSIAGSLATIAQAMQVNVKANAAAPNLRKSLAVFGSFDWVAAGIEVIESDDSGPSLVEWNGKQFTRRAGAGKFGESIWFSRSIGKDEAGENQYERLITFKDYSQAEAVPTAVRKKVAVA
jgi:hypothetical protein